MKKHSYIALALAAVLTACGSGSSSSSETKPTATGTPRELLEELNKAYNGNAIQAQRTWGGKRLLLGGSFFSAGKNPDGTILVLLTTSAPGSVGEFRFDPRHVDFTAKLNKDDAVTATCVVDPKYDGNSGATLIDCAPGTVTPA
jgi:hypothetical protein